METQKDLTDYWKIFLKRKKSFIIPALLVFLFVTAVAIFLPSKYESKAVILIEEQQIPPEYVRATVTGYADQRIQSLTQQILSRTRLWEIVQQFNLYQKMRESASREEILDKMKDDITFETVSAEVRDPKRKTTTQTSVTIAFSVAYRGKEPSVVQRVTGTLSSLYLEENLKIREQQAKTTTRFLEAELKEIQERIQTLGAKLTDFKSKHEGMTPELQQFNLTQAERLETEIKQLDVQIRAAQDKKIYLTGQLATVSPDLLAGAGKDAYVSPALRLRMIKVALADLQSKFSDDHPDVRKAKREMAELDKIVGGKGGGSTLNKQRLIELKAELAQKRGRYSDQHPEVRKLEKEIANLEKATETTSIAGTTELENPAYVALLTQIQTANHDVESLTRQKAALQERLKEFRRRLEQTPQIEQEYLALTRDYDNAHKKHQEVMNKIMEARIAEGMEEHQKGEKFTLIDPASYPEKPVSPPRLLIFLAGLVMSVGGGLGTLALMEFSDHSVKSPEELGWLTGLPVIGAISLIQTAEDVARRIFRRRLIWAASGLTLVVGIVLFHFFYMDLWVLAATLQRLLNKYI